jgi:hypothetical protein|tara:strand:+ start:204 stop:464 length:261 start_codon:yes stop_codon:yes gene_type:complete
MSETFTLAIKIVPTMANLFGCHDDVLIIDQLCQISDLAANVRTSLREGDIEAAAKEMSFTQSPHCMELVEGNFMQFIEWTYTDEEG